MDCGFFGGAWWSITEKSPLCEGLEKKNRDSVLGLVPRLDREE